MSNRGLFLLHCAKVYADKSGHGMRHTLGMLDRTNAVNYLLRNYDRLNASTNQHIVDSVDHFLEAHRAVTS